MKFRHQNSDTKNQTKIQTKIRQTFRPKFRQKIRQKFRLNFRQNSDKKSDKTQTKSKVKFRHKSDRMPGLGIFRCSGSFQKVLFILKMQLQTGFCCFQKTLKISSPCVFWGPPAFFSRMFWGEGAQKKGDASPFFILLWIMSSEMLHLPRFFNTPTGPGPPTHRVPKPPQQQKKIQITRKSSRI